MSNIRTVTLELLRHGPAHNQLLSPLTKYLALCGNHPATTTFMPFEHNQLLVRLRALAYKDSLGTREFQLKDLAQIMADMLGKIPSLISELAGHPGGEEALIHLRLILSASELALLPFELATAPIGIAGAGQALALQSQQPLCVTREVRRVNTLRFEWPETPRILFVAASPPGTGDIPVEAHLLALRQAVEPWVKHAASDSERKHNVEEHLVFRQSASVHDIEQACSKERFTHVHILAHGAPYNEGEDHRYGLALHKRGDANALEVISGARLAAVLRTYAQDGKDGLRGPAVVTLASCESGNIGSVTGTGASIAHALHEDGIPLVVASQFPLSFAGSVLLVQELYGGLLWGADPRQLLHHVRRQLHAQLPDTHDWASLVAYASLPQTLTSQLFEVRFKRARKSINAAMDQADRATWMMSLHRTSRQGNSTRIAIPDTDAEELWRQAQPRLAAAKRRLTDLLDYPYPNSAGALNRIYGLLASTEKREAEISYHVCKSTSAIDDDRRARYLEESGRTLRRARDAYLKAFEADKCSNWPMVQYLSLTAVLEQSDEVRSTRFHDLWTMARVLSESDLRLQDRERVAWAYGNLIELYLLALLMTPGYDVPAAAEAREKALYCTNELVLRIPRDSFEIYSTRRQILRYIEWFPHYLRSPNPLESLATEIFTKLPQGPRFF